METTISAVYIMTNKRRTVLYTGVTNDLVRRVYEHRIDLDRSCFTARYRAHRLVYFETYADIYLGIALEKTIKGWLRRKKIALIETTNPGWRDLWECISS